MPGSLSRAKRYRDRAGECLRLSKIATSPEERAKYRQMAAHYVTLAEAEKNPGRQSDPVDAS